MPKSGHKIRNPKCEPNTNQKTPSVPRLKCKRYSNVQINMQHKYVKHKICT